MNHQLTGKNKTEALFLYGQRIKDGKILFFHFSEPLKRAVAKFRSAAAHLDQMIRSSDLANET